MTEHVNGYKSTEENTIIYETRSCEQTRDLAFVMGENAKPGSVYALEGDLGVGKTIFANGFGKGIGIEEDLTSPTFTIVQVYDEGKVPLYHFDMYRIGDISELQEIGWDEYINGDGIVLIEWPQNIAEELPDKYKLIRIEKDLEKGEDYRIIRVIDIDNSKR